MDFVVDLQVRGGDIQASPPAARAEDAIQRQVEIAWLLYRQCGCNRRLRYEYLQEKEEKGDREVYRGNGYRSLRAQGDRKARATERYKV